MRLMVAGSLGAVVFAWFAGSMWFGGGSAEVPVVQAQPGPMRVKPANPGGLQVPGADTIFSSNDGNGVDKLAPPPQTPDLQALQAPPQQAPAPKPAEAAKLAAATPLPPPAAPTAEAEKLPAAAAALKAPANAAAMTPPVPAAAPKPPAAMAASKRAAPAADGRPPGVVATDHRPTPPAMGASHGALVQLGALSSEQSAHEEWSLLAKRLPQFLAGKQPSVSKVEHDGHTYWRLRTGGFADMAQATTFCLRMRAQGASCSVADF